MFARTTVYLIAMMMSVAWGQGALAQQGTEEQREACTPDAFRLCTQAMPDAGRVETCLRNAGPRLSRACYAVFYPPDAAQKDARRAGPPLPPSAPVPSPRQDDDED